MSIKSKVNMGIMKLKCNVLLKTNKISYKQYKLLKTMINFSDISISKILNKSNIKGAKFSEWLNTNKYIENMFDKLQKIKTDYIKSKLLKITKKKNLPANIIQSKW